MSRVAQLQDLFSSLYEEPAEIKAFMKRAEETEPSAKQIRWGRALQLVASEVVSWLERKRLINRTLFELLRAANPTRDQDIREVAFAWEIALPPMQGSQEILFVAAVGIHDAPLPQVAVELREIRSTWGEERVRDLSAARQRDLFIGLARLPTVVHFAGHGSGKGLLLLGSDGNAVELPSVTLSEAMKVAGEGDRAWLLILNACDSLQVARDCAHAGCWVIGVDGFVDDKPAEVFTAKLHKALADADDPRAALPGAFAQAAEAARKHGRAPYRLFPDGPGHRGTSQSDRLVT